MNHQIAAMHLTSSISRSARRWTFADTGLAALLAWTSPDATTKDGESRGMLLLSSDGEELLADVCRRLTMEAKSILKKYRRIGLEGAGDSVEDLKLEDYAERCDRESLKARLITVLEVEALEAELFGPTSLC